MDGESNRKQQLNLFSEEQAKETSSKPKSSAPKKEVRSRKSAKLTFRLADLPEDRVLPITNLRELREHRNWSLEDVHRQTKIPVKHLVALENGSRDFLPSINVRAFLRTLSRLYSVDWESLMPPEAIEESKVEIMTLDEVVIDENETADSHWAAPLFDSYLKFRKFIKNFGKKRDRNQ